MINDNEVRDAMEISGKELFTMNQYLKDKEMADLHGERFRKMIKCLRTFNFLAQAYLKAGKEMPEKIKDTWGDQKYERGYNQAIDDCRLALTRLEARKKEDIENKVVIKIMEFKNGNCETPVFGNGNVLHRCGACFDCIRDQIIDEIAKSIREHLMGKGK